MNDSTTGDMKRRNPADILRTPRPPISRLIAPAVRWSAIASSIAMAIIAAAILLDRVVRKTPSEDWGNIAIWSLGWWILLFVVLSGVRLFVISRLFADRAFTVLGVLATFFGLAMLLVFFTQLGFEAYDWFTITPQLVEKQNRFLQERVANVEADIKKELAELDEEMRFEMSQIGRASCTERG